MGYYKKCTKCKKNKKATSFYKDSQKRDLLSSRCKQCILHTSKMIYKTDTYKAHHRDYCRAWRIKYKINYLYIHAKHRAKKAGIEFKITRKDLGEIPKTCPVLGIKIVLDNSMPSDNSPSVDRIDNTKGYIPGNVAIISRKANTLKNSSSISDLRKILKYISKYI